MSETPHLPFSDSNLSCGLLMHAIFHALPHRSFFEEAMPHILTLSTDLFSNYV